MNKKSPSVAVVILNWNGIQYLEKFLPSVIATDYDNFQVIVADNNSSDGSIEFLQEYFPQIQTILLEKNYGFAEGYNRALKNVDAEYFILLNSDVEVTKNWISPVIELMENDKNIAACQPKILSLNNKDKFEYAGASGGWLDMFGYPFCRGRVFDFCENDVGQYDDATEVCWATGAAMFVRPGVFAKCGGFDPYFFAHQEEIDLCWRMQNEGYSIYVQPKSVVYHLGGGSLAQGNKRKVFFNFRNNLVMMRKNLNDSERFRKLFYRKLLDGLAAIQFLAKGKGGSFLSVVKAHAAYYRWTVKNKHTKRNKRKLSELSGIYNGSIVKAFFLKDQKTFSEIVGNKK